MANYFQRRARRIWGNIGDRLFGQEPGSPGGSQVVVRGEARMIARDPGATVCYPGLTVAKMLWDTDWFSNTTMNAGLTDMLAVNFDAGTQKTQWYIVPINNSPTPSIVAGDTAASHAGWAEATTYSESTRQQYNPTCSNKVMTNTASAATITASGSLTVYGVFLISDNTKSGSSGMLAAAAAFTGGNQGPARPAIFFTEFH
jgi:hypothetical protein